jgi:hypothetical protein
MRIASLLCLLSALALARPAAAGDKALAESLFQEGRRLMAEGSYEQACERFAGSQAQDPSPGTLVNLGQCHEARGMTATAWAYFRQAEALARNLGRSEHEAHAAERAAALEPKLSKLRIDPPADAPSDLRVLRGGVRLPSESLGVAVAVDPGSYEIEASAPGRRTWRGNVDVGAEADSAVIAIPSLEKEPAKPPDRSPESPAVPHADGDSAPARTIGWVLIGVGAAAVVTGGVFGLLVMQQSNNAEDDPELCPNKQCSPRGLEEIDSAEQKALISTIAIGAGLATAAVGAVLIVTSKSSRERGSGALRVAPVAGRRSGGFAVVGSF